MSIDPKRIKFITIETIIITSTTMRIIFCDLFFELLIFLTKLNSNNRRYITKTIISATINKGLSIIKLYISEGNNGLLLMVE